mgnify:CR=1 FL=1|jgi:hypothetical protein
MAKKPGDDRVDGPQNMTGQQSGEQNLAGGGKTRVADKAPDRAATRDNQGPVGNQGPVEDLDNPTPS